MDGDRARSCAAATTTASSTTRALERAGLVSPGLRRRRLAPRGRVAQPRPGTLVAPAGPAGPLHAGGRAGRRCSRRRAAPPCSTSARTSWAALRHPRLRRSRGTAVVIRTAEVLQEGEIYTRPLRSARVDRRVRPRRRPGRGVGAAVHLPRLPLRRGHRMARRPRGRRGRGRHRRPGLPHGPRAHRLVQLLRPAGRTGCTRTSCGACAATSSIFPPTARSATSASAGPATSRCSPRPQSFLYDVSGMLSSWLRDVAVEQLPDGTVPWYVPVIPAHRCGRRSARAAAWGDVATLTPWDALRQLGRRGDPRRASTTAPRRWVELVERLAGPGPAVGQRLPARRLARPRRTTAGSGRRPHRPLPRGHRLLRPLGANAWPRTAGVLGPHRRRGPVRRAGRGGPQRLHRRIRRPTAG